MKPIKVNILSISLVTRMAIQWVELPFLYIVILAGMTLKELVAEVLAISGHLILVFFVFEIRK